MARPRLALLLLVGLVVDRGAAATAPAGRVAPAAPPLLLELFTSQGCSSCPPAERLLSRLAREPALRGRLLPLAFHVDYWDSIGWRDPFSSAAWSARQGRYAAALGERGVYTPQLVVDGRAQVVGSDEGEVRRQLARALAAGARSARIELAPPSWAPSGRRLWVDLSVALDAPRGSAGAVEGREPRLHVALVQSGLRTAIPRGENRGLELVEDHVVRRLVPGFRLDPGGAARGRIALDVDPAWRGGRLGVAAFVQEPRTLEILGAAFTEPAR